MTELFNLTQLVIGFRIIACNKVRQKIIGYNNFRMFEQLPKWGTVLEN